MQCEDYIVRRREGKQERENEIEVALNSPLLGSKSRASHDFRFSLICLRLEKADMTDVSLAFC